MQYNLPLYYVVIYYLNILHSRLVHFESEWKGRGIAPTKNSPNIFCLPPTHHHPTPDTHTHQLNMKKIKMFRVHPFAIFCIFQVSPCWREGAYHV